MKGLGWDEENWEARSDFHKEIVFIAKYLGVSQGKVELDVCHPAGDIVIFVDDVYAGYLDSTFYDFMETGEEFVPGFGWNGLFCYFDELEGLDK